jgi:hypothetical protein
MEITLSHFELGEATTTSGFQLHLVYISNSSITVFSTIGSWVPEICTWLPGSLGIVYPGYLWYYVINEWNPSLFLDLGQLVKKFDHPCKAPVVIPQGFTWSCWGT